MQPARLFDAYALPGRWVGSPSVSRTHSFLMATKTTTASGVAKSTPSHPYSRPNATTANRVTAGGSLTAWRCTRGVITLLSSCWIAR